MPKIGNQRVIWNGTPQTFANTAYSITNSISPTFTVGADRNNTNGMVGDIQEVIVYAGAGGADMTDIQIQQIQSYLAVKYGISLDPSGQPNYTASNGTSTFWTGASNTGYQKNIFGLGRDNGSALYQKQAFSYGDSSISIYIGGSTLAGLNSTNSGSIAANNSFLMLGDNGLAGYTNSINYPSSTVFANGSTTSNLNVISNRVWKAQTTTQASWTVNINANKYATATYVLVSSSPSFPSGATTRIYPVTAGTASNVVINDGNYVAFASFATGPGGIGLNLALWLRADAGVTGTSAVSQWNDQSGNNRHHVQATAANQPSLNAAGGNYLMNYNPSVRFDGTTDFMNISSYMDLATVSPQIFVVSRLRQAPINYQVTYSMWTNLLHSGWFPNGPASWTGYNNPLATSKPNNPLYALASHIFNLGSGSAPNTSTVYWNGTKTVGAVSAYNASSAQYEIGRNTGSASYYLDGDIQEVIIYTGPRSTDISSNNLLRIQSYLAVKYGISLDPAGQPNYMASNNTTEFWTGSSNTGYQNNIFGLGRDDNSNLEQEQAYSMGDSSLSIYLGTTLAPLNSMNGNSIAANYSFLMLGDNNLNGYTTYGAYPIGTSFSNGPTTSPINNRTNRIWKSQTSTQNSWTVNINTNKFGANQDPSVTMYMMVSTSAAFTPSNTRLYPIVNGTASNVVVNSGEYLAIGSFMQSPGGVNDQLVLWTRSDDGATAGSVATWKDNSISYNPVEVTGAMSLSAANDMHNFHPYYTGFTSTNHFYDAISSVNGTSTIPSSLSMFSAIRQTAAGSGRIIGVDDDATFAAEPGYSISLGRPYFYKFTGTINSEVYSTAMPLSKSSIASFNASNTAIAASGLKIGLDGLEETKTRVGTYNMVHQRLRIGYGAWDLAGPFPGDIMEVIWYNKSLDATESNKVNSYLAIKNGITLGNTTTPVNYLNTSAAVVWAGSAAFQNHVAGLGRDDIEALNQKQSHSINANTNGQVTMSLATLAASNAANTGVFAKDQTYMIWGDNGVTTSLATASTAFTYNGSSVNYRMNRIWQVQNTQQTQSVQIIIPVSMLGNTGNAAINTSCQKLRLIAASDAGITNITAAANLVLSGTNYVCTYTFPAGTSYFTFGRIEQATEGVAYLPTATTPSVYNSDCEENGWRYWYSDGNLLSHSGTQRIFAIHRNGNGNSATLNGFTGTVNYNQGPFPYEVTDGTHTTRVMSRTLTINADAGPYTTNGGMRVRFYIDSSEVISTIFSDATSSKWFKHSDGEPTTLGNQTPYTINNATFYSSVVAGIEDGVHYVEYSNIQTFSTFGFASNEGSAVSLPLALLSFNAVKLQNGQVEASWKTAEAKNISSFELQRSSDGKTWKYMATIVSDNNATGDHYNYMDMAPLNGKSYYRLKIISNKESDISYSPVRMIQNSLAAIGDYSVYPNPAGDFVTLSWNNEQLQPGAFKLYNIQGQLQEVTVSREDAQITFTISSLPAGIYYLTIQDKAGNNHSKMIHKK